MKHEFQPKGVCSQKITFDLEDGRIYNLSFTGGCNGNLKAIGRLAEGCEAREIAEKLKGNTCGPRNTSCADQLAQALLKAVEA